MLTGCAHTDDIGYLFTNSNTPHVEEGSTEDSSWKKIVKLWTNFAKYGNPTPTKDEFGVIWDPVLIPDEMGIMNIGSEFKMEKNPNGETIKFWKHIFDQSPDTVNML